MDNRKVLLLMAAVVLELVSCTKNQIVGEIPNVSNVADTIGFKLQFYELTQLNTKAVVKLNESLIEDVNLYIINEQGALMNHFYFTADKLLNNSYNKDIMVYKSHKYKVYAILNWGGMLYMNSEEQILSKRYTIDKIDDIAKSNGGVIFTGVTDLIELYNGITLEIPVKRIVSKVSIVCDFTRLNSGVSLQVQRVSLKNAPKETVLFGSNVAGSVINGEMRDSEQLLSGISTTGISFYTFENLQGTVSGATSNKEKASLLGSRRNVATYIEVECALVSNTKRGNIVYKFYLGTSHTDANIFRNTSQTIKVSFVGNASVNENSVSVDNSDIKDRVTDMYIDPAVIHFKGYYGDTQQCKAVIIPSTAADKRVTWSCPSSYIAKVDQNGLVTVYEVGTTYIIATSVDNPAVSASCKISVDIR